MAQLLVRDLEDEVKTGLKKRARRHGRSTEEEVREILRNAVRGEEKAVLPLGRQIRRLFRGIGLDQDIVELRGYPAKPADLSR